MSDSLRPHRLQHARFPCPPLSPRVCSNSCPLSWWCHPTISSSAAPFSFLLSIFPIIRVFSNESALHIRWPKYWIFSFSIGPSNEYSGLISFRIDWFDLLAVQGTLKSLLQHHSSKASIVQRSGFFMVQLSHPYMTTGKTVALTRWTFVSKVTSLLFNTLFRFVIAFLPRSKHLLNFMDRWNLVNRVPLGTSLVVQWLGLHAFTAVQSLVGILRFKSFSMQPKKKKNRALLDLPNSTRFS